MDRESSHLQINRREWDRTSDWYDRRCRTVLSGSRAMAWGLWRIPEARVGWLGPVQGRRILELGCGAARWSLALRQRGARAIGLDQSIAQLTKARRLARRARVSLPLVRANAEQIPFPDRTFDRVFCDWGAMTFANPRRTVPECARVLKAGGRLVFATGSLFGLVSLDLRRDRMTRRLVRPYFGPIRHRVGRMVEFRPGYGEWIDLFRRAGLTVEWLYEHAPPPGVRSRYLGSDSAWGRRWPLESVWSVRKNGPVRMPAGPPAQTRAPPRRPLDPRRASSRETPRRHSDRPVRARERP